MNFRELDQIKEKQVIGNIAGEENIDYAQNLMDYWY